VRVENTRGALDDQPVQLLRPNGLSKGFAETMQKIENKRFLDLNFFMGALQPSDPPNLKPSGKKSIRRQTR
jgi:hypothetical protein